MTDTRKYTLPEGVFASIIESFCAIQLFRGAVYTKLRLSVGGSVTIFDSVQIYKLSSQLTKRGMRVETPQNEVALNDLLREVIADKIPICFERKHRNNLIGTNKREALIEVITIL